MDDEKCHWCQGYGQKWNPHNSNAWSCSPCQATGLAKFYLPGAAKFARMPEMGIYLVWNTGEPVPY
jgi:hypothetical protein